MANTRFPELYGFIRTFLNDLNPFFTEHSNSMLDSYIETYVAISAKFVKNGDKPEFTVEIPTVQEKAFLSAKISILVLEHTDTFRFSTKIYNVGESVKDIMRKINSLKDLIEEFEDGGLPVETSGDWRALFGITTNENTVDEILNDFRNV